MSCLPGMPCYNSPVVKIVYPPGCDPTPHEVVSSDAVRYDGPNLPCTGVQTGDDLTTALEKIDTKICSEELVASIIQTISQNEVLRAYFCELANSCIPTTTSTSSSSTTTTSSTSSTTTTTTTSGPVEVYASLGTTFENACNETQFLPGTPIVLINGATNICNASIAIFDFASYGLSGLIYIKQTAPILINSSRPFVVDSSGLFATAIGNCSTCPTTTTTTTLV